MRQIYDAKYHVWRLRCDQLSYDIGKRCRFAGRLIDPDDFGAADGADGFRIVAAPDFLYDFETRTSWRTGICPDFDVAGIDKGSIVGTVAMDDDSFRSGFFATTDVRVPLDEWVVYLSY